ncbi:MAG: ribokinase [Anaerolineae bacterium]|jgi:ribokinase
MPNRRRVAVVGAFNLDLVFWAERRPQRGESLMGERFGMFPGGKGFNQAVAAARLGAQATMIGRLGTDPFAEPFLDTLDAEGIDARYVARDPKAGTGVASPVVEADGSNSIVFVPRANMRLSLSDIEAAADAISASDVLLFQLETPPSASLRAAELAREAGARVIFNPAPAVPFPEELWQFCDVLVPNNIEAAMLAGQSGDDPAQAAQTLLLRGLQAVVVTLGEEGALLVTPEGEQYFSPYEVEVIDSVAAGDAFCGALAVRLAESASLAESVRFANAAGALAVTVAGAAPSMPRRHAVEALLSGAAVQ